jgi:hypothetical protein
VLDGSSWVMNVTVRSSTGSTQNAVLAAPPHPKSPTDPGDLRRHRVDGDRADEPEADAVEGGLAEQRAAERGEVGVPGQVVRGRVLDGARRQQAHPVELAARRSISAKRR